MTNEMKIDDNPFENRVTWFSGLFALILLFCIPFGYSFFSYHYQKHVLEENCQLQAAIVNEFINHGGSDQRFEMEKLKEISQRYNKHYISLLTINGKLVAESNTELQKIINPVMTCSIQIYKSNALLGQLEIRESIYPWILETVAISVFSIVIGTFIFLFLQSMSLRVLSRVKSALHESENRCKSVVASLQEGILVVASGNEKIIASNDSAQRIVGGCLADWVCAENCTNWVLTEEGNPLTIEKHPVRHTLMTSQPVTRMIMGLIINEITHWIAVNTQPMWRGEAKKPYAVVVSIVDITEHRQAREKLKMAAQAFENTADGIMITDVRLRIISVNRAFMAITGYSSEEVIGQTPAILKSGRHGPEFYAQMWQTLSETGTWHGEIYDRKKSGEIYPEWLNISTVKDDQGRPTYYVGAFSDITTHKSEEEARLHRLAYYDALTGLLNRAGFIGHGKIRLAHTRNYGHCFALFFIDLDHFKTINNSLGHAVGDQLLKAVATRLQHDFYPNDLVAHFGYDKFIVTLDTVRHAEDLTEAVQKLTQCLALPFQIDGKELFISASVGVSCYPADAQDIETLLKHAEIAMYLTKNNGRNGYQLYREEMNRNAWEFLDLCNRLQMALQRNEFMVYFQPRLDIRTQQTVGIEALIRWRNPELGFISPAKFIPLAEANGSILAIGAWVLEAACQQMAEWRQLGLPLQRVSVNLSARQFRELGLVDQIQRVLDQTGLDPKGLELEITESMAMADAQQTVVKLQALKETGVTIAIDDFGTGYSSLSYLRRFPFDYLKVDQSFVREMLSDATALAITDMIINLGKIMEVCVVAEGVERIEELAHLRNRGCDEVQGFYFAKPMPAEELKAWILDRHIAAGK